MLEDKVLCLWCCDLGLLVWVCLYSVHPGFGLIILVVFFKRLSVQSRLEHIDFSLALVC